MRRKEFFSAVGLSAGIFFLAPTLNSCSKDSGAAGGTTPPTNQGGAVDFTLDLTKSANAALNTVGGAILTSGIIVAQVSNGTYVALSSVCTHQGGTIEFDAANNRFHCPNHGSNFNTSGGVINGPATSALKKYNVQLTASNLRVYA